MTNYMIHFDIMSINKIIIKCYHTNKYHSQTAYQAFLVFLGSGLSQY